MAKTVTDLVGRKFGKLTVVERASDYIVPKNGQHQIMWKCKCDCGNTTVVRGSTLKNKTSTSCGCVHKQIVREIGYANKKYNTYDLTGEYGIGYTTNGEEFYFDLEDYDLIKDYCWSIDNHGYVVCGELNGVILFHVLVMNTKKGEDVDHIHHKRNDNRKSELRVVTRSQNQMNVGLSSNNVSGVTGVHFDKNRGKWVAQIGINRERIYLGSFDNFDDAVKVRKEAEEKYFGEFSYDNSMTKECLKYGS